MRKYDNILVPYDGSSSTEYTVSVASQIAQWNNSHVLVMVPFYPDAGRPEFDEIVSGVRAMSRRDGVKMDVIFQGGRPSEAVIDTAYKEKCDLIVIGKAAMSGLEKMVMGSFTGRIIGHANSDVIIVPEFALLRWRRILLCTDGSKYSSAAIKHAIEYARLHAGQINAMSVLEFNDEFYAQSPDGADKLTLKAMQHLEAVAQTAKAAGLEANTFIREGNRVGKIIEVSDETKADIIFMGSHERIWLGSLIMGSIARDVAMKVGCPVFIIKP